MCKGERVIAVSDTVQRYITDNYPATDLNKVVLIFRGVDHDEFPYGYKAPSQWLAEWYLQFPQTQGKIILTLPGRLTRLKGHHDFIAHIERLKQAGLNVCGLVVGGVDSKRQPYALSLYDSVASKNLANDIVFTGARSDIREIYSISSIVYSLSTKPESFGRTVLEALRIGAPTVGYDHGGVGEILSEMFPQGKVEMGNAVALDDAVRRLLADKCIPLKSQCFTRKEMLESTLAIYGSVVSLLKNK
jgi:glycosyltransferase involved in cell wall biosynthesis